MVEDKSEKTEQHVPVSSPLPAQPLQQTQKDIAIERIDQWRERAKKATSSLTFKPRATEGETGTKTVTLSYGVSGKEPVSSEVIESTLCAAYGSANSDYAIKLLTQALPGFFLRNSGESVAQVANAISGALLSLNPKDEIEGMLCTRLLVLHNQYMDFLGRVANPEQTDAGIDSNINRGTKLMRIYNETLEALNRHRRKGEQKVIVQHVNVGDGGQAVVGGQFNHGGGECEKK